jgi:hypothetical protein
MAIDLGFSGQESDVNRACSAFGLDTVNYRAFPNNGPVPAPEPEPIPAASAPPPAPVPVAPPAEVASTPDMAAVPQQIQPPVLMVNAPAPHFAPPPVPAAALPPAPGQQWATAPGPAAAPVNYPPTGMPPAAGAPYPYPSAQAQNDAGMPGGGFSLLRQALPSAYPNPASPMPAFAMARSPLQPLPPSGGAPQARPVNNPAANPESFGIAFGTAFNAAFGHAGAGPQGSIQGGGFQRPQS